MRLVYLYTTHGAAEGPFPHNPDGPTENSYALNIGTEGFFYLFKRLLDIGVLDEVLIFVESVRSPGLRVFSDKFSCRVVPHISDLFKYMRDDDIVYCRGGFKGWFPTLEEISAKGNWLIFYGAATQRWRWLFWDLVLNDLIAKTYRDSAGRVQYAFHKPTHPMLFSFDPEMPRDYDVCIGASHIHDKKAQWMGIDMLIEYRRKYKRDLQAVLPGRSMNGLKTTEMFDKIRAFQLPLAMPGMLPRSQMINIYNRSKLYLHYGGAGQNDRGVLEAMACGCPVAIMEGRGMYHPPDINRIAFQLPPDPQKGAEWVEGWMGGRIDWDRFVTHKEFEDTHSIENVIIPEFKHFLDFFRDNRKADRDLLWNYLNSSGS